MATARPTIPALCDPDRQAHNFAIMRVLMEKQRGRSLTAGEYEDVRTAWIACAEETGVYGKNRLILEKEAGLEPFYVACAQPAYEVGADASIFHFSTQGARPITAGWVAGKPLPTIPLHMVFSRVDNGGGYMPLGNKAPVFQLRPPSINPFTVTAPDGAAARWRSTPTRRVWSQLTR